MPKWVGPSRLLEDSRCATVKVSLPNRSEAEVVLPVDRPRVALAERESNTSLRVRVMGAAGAPAISVNDRAAAAAHVNGAFVVTIPAGVTATGVLRVQVTDEVGRRSETFTLPADE